MVSRAQEKKDKQGDVIALPVNASAGLKPK